MGKWLFSTLLLSVPLGAIGAEPHEMIPRELWGIWTVRREIPTTTISCWDEDDARKLIGTEIEYSAEVFRWRDVITKDPAATVTTETSGQFHDENSGGGENDSQVTFEQLGIKAKSVTHVVVDHPPAAITRATVEIPGDDVLIKAKNKIVFSVCNAYFEADRDAAAP
jgi:hypothetical protein